MPSHSPSQIRRAIRHSLRALVDPELNKNQREAVRQYFGYECAYCGASLPAGTRSHIDHLVSVADMGPNHISNRVLACASCNGDEKLEHDWSAFLKNKLVDPALVAQRRARIMKWVELHQSNHVPLSSEVELLLTVLEQRAITEYNAAVAALREARRKVE